MLRMNSCYLQSVANCSIRNINMVRFLHIVCDALLFSLSISMVAKERVTLSLQSAV